MEDKLQQFYTRYLEIHRFSEPGPCDETCQAIACHTTLSEEGPLYQIHAGMSCIGGDNLVGEGNSFEDALMEAETNLELRLMRLETMIGRKL